MKRKKGAPAESLCSSHMEALRRGIKDGTPVALGYFAVAFSLGIVAREAGLSPLQGFLASLLNNASAGEYAGFTLIAALAPYAEVALMTLIINARYFLMSCALSQKLSPETSLAHRLLIGFDVTDELFGLAIAQPGWLDPFYFYGAMLVAMPGWAAGTGVGIAAGNILPARVVSALSVALYGMFLAIVIPPARRDRVIAVLVLLSFLISFAVARIDFFSGLSEGTRTILITLLLAGGAAALFPRKEEEGDA